MAKKKEVPKAPSVDDHLAELGIPAFDPSMFAATNQPSPIGASESFFTPAYQERQLPGERLPTDFAPWRSGDEALPGTWDRNDKARLQALMAAAGLYPKGTSPAAGYWRSEDATAMKSVLEFANYQGIDDINEAVRTYATMATTSGLAATSARAPLVVQYANPEAVRQVVRKTSLNLMGRRLSDAEEQKIISGFQAQSASSQRADYGVSETGGSVTQPLDAQSYAESQLEGTEEAGDQRYLSAFGRMAKTFSDTFVEGPNLTGKGGVA